MPDIETLKLLSQQLGEARKQLETDIEIEVAEQFDKLAAELNVVDFQWTSGWCGWKLSGHPLSPLSQKARDYWNQMISPKVIPFLEHYGLEYSVGGVSAGILVTGRNGKTADANRWRFDLEKVKKETKALLLLTTDISEAGAWADSEGEQEGCDEDITSIVSEMRHTQVCMDFHYARKRRLLKS